MARSPRRRGSRRWPGVWPPERTRALFRRRSSRSLVIETDRLELRPPQLKDFEAWAALRKESKAFLAPWEPDWAHDHLTIKAFRNRVVWSARAIDDGRACPLFLVRARDQLVLGGVTVDNIRRGPAMACAIGYWIGKPHARRGYMAEALTSIRAYAFGYLSLSRIEAASLPENQASRGLLERCGFKYEGVAQSYLQIAGRWRTHVLYAALREDRRGQAGDD